MHPEPSIPLGLAHFAASSLFGSLLVMVATVMLLASVVFMGGGTGGSASDRLLGLTVGVIALPLFLFGRYLIVQHGISSRRPDGDGPGGGGGGGGPLRPPTPPTGPTLREQHVAAGRSMVTAPPLRVSSGPPRQRVRTPARR